jgi:hypothetical protein
LEAELAPVESSLSPKALTGLAACLCRDSARCGLSSATHVVEVTPKGTPGCWMTWPGSPRLALLPVRLQCAACSVSRLLDDLPTGDSKTSIVLVYLQGLVFPAGCGMTWARPALTCARTGQAADDLSEQDRQTKPGKRIGLKVAELVIPMNIFTTERDGHE